MGWKIKKPKLKKLKKLKSASKNAFKKTVKVAVTAVAVGAGLVTGLFSHKSSPAYVGNFAESRANWCNPVGKLSEPPEYFVIKMKDGNSYAIPSNAIPSNAIPSNIAEAYAIPSNAIPSNAIPSNAIPANFWDYAIPSNALPSNALPASILKALPASQRSALALPASALPARALPASFYKTDPQEILALVQKAASGKALPASAILRDQLLQADMKTGALSSDAALASRVSSLKYSLTANTITKSTCQSEPQPSLLSRTCNSRSTTCVKPISFSLAPYQSKAAPETEFGSSGANNLMTIQFSADSYVLTRGQCTNLRWNATGASKVWVNDIQSDISGVKQVCPDASKNYSAVAEDAGGSQVSSSLSIQVQEPAVESNSGQELGGIDRCRVFDGINISSLVLEWQEGSPLSMYFKIPGGVPGLEKEIVGDTDVWKYSLEIGSYNSQNCSYKDYSERLYCTIKLPKEYSLAVVPMSLSVNGCDSPVYSLEKFGMVEMVIPESASGGGGKKDNSEEGDEQASVCPAGETYHAPNIYWSGGCCTDGHWYYYYSDDPAPGCWN